VTLTLPHRDEVAQEILWHSQATEESAWENETYEVTVREVQFTGGVPLTHLEITRHDRQPIHDWRDLQHIKTEICGPEREAVEIYPAADLTVDFSNTYHLWVYPEGHRIL
jgi:hypothetical protein